MNVRNFFAQIQLAASLLVVVPAARADDAPAPVAVEQPAAPPAVPPPAAPAPAPARPTVNVAVEKVAPKSIDIRVCKLQVKDNGQSAFWDWWNDGADIYVVVDVTVDGKRLEPVTIDFPRADDNTTHCRNRAVYNWNQGDAKATPKHIHVDAWVMLSNGARDKTLTQLKTVTEKGAKASDVGVLTATPVSLAAWAGAHSTDALVGLLIKNGDTKLAADSLTITIQDSDKAALVKALVSDPTSKYAVLTMKTTIDYQGGAVPDCPPR